MEKLFFDLSEHEFSKSRKVLLWIFCVLFLAAGLGIIYMSSIQHNLAIHFSFSIPPFAISLFVGIVAYMSTFKRKNHYFLIDEEKVEYRFGLIKPVKYSHLWQDIKEIHIPHREKKVRLVYKSGSSHTVNLTWLERKKTNHIRKQFFIAARELNINILKVPSLARQIT